MPTPAANCWAIVNRPLPRTGSKSFGNPSQSLYLSPRIIDLKQPHRAVDPVFVKAFCDCHTKFIKMIPGQREYARTSATQGQPEQTRTARCCQRICKTRN